MCGWCGCGITLIVVRKYIQGTEFESCTKLLLLHFAFLPLVKTLGHVSPPPIYRLNNGSDWLFKVLFKQPVLKAKKENQNSKTEECFQENFCPFVHHSSFISLSKKFGYLFGLLVQFYGISTFVGYLMPYPFPTNISSTCNDSVQQNLIVKNISFSNYSVKSNNYFSNSSV